LNASVCKTVSAAFLLKIWNLNVNAKRKLWRKPKRRQRRQGALVRAGFTLSISGFPLVRGKWGL
jgi:hypothetical protein